MQQKKPLQNIFVSAILYLFLFKNYIKTIQKLCFNFSANETQTKIQAGGYLKLYHVEHYAVMKYLQKKVMTPNEINKILVGALAGNNPFLHATVKNWAVKFNQGKDSTEDNPRQEFKT